MAPRLQWSTATYMECRIDVTHQAGTYVVRVAGRLTDVQVPDLLRVCGKLTPLQLDLAQLDSANSVGIEALQRLQKSGAQIVGATHFIQLLLDNNHTVGQ
jgi:hypothetical protein